MKNVKLLICILTAILLATTVFAVLPALSQQLPLDITTMYVGTVGQPKNVKLLSHHVNAACFELLWPNGALFLEYFSKVELLAYTTFFVGVPTASQYGARVRDREERRWQHNGVEGLTSMLGIV